MGGIAGTTNMQCFLSKTVSPATKLQGSIFLPDADASMVTRKPMEGLAFL